MKWSIIWSLWLPYATLGYSVWNDPRQIQVSFIRLIYGTQQWMKNVRLLDRCQMYLFVSTSVAWTITHKISTTKVKARIQHNHERQSLSGSSSDDRSLVTVKGATGNSRPHAKKNRGQHLNSSHPWCNGTVTINYSYTCIMYLAMSSNVLLFQTPRTVMPSGHSTWVCEPLNPHPNITVVWTQNKPISLWLDYNKRIKKMLQ